MACELNACAAAAVAAVVTSHEQNGTAADATGCKAAGAASEAMCDGESETTAVNGTVVAERGATVGEDVGAEAESQRDGSWTGETAGDAVDADVCPSDEIGTGQATCDQSSISTTEEVRDATAEHGSLDAVIADNDSLVNISETVISNGQVSGRANTVGCECGEQSVHTAGVRSLTLEASDSHADDWQPAQVGADDDGVHQDATGREHGPAVMEKAVQSTGQQRHLQAQAGKVIAVNNGKDMPVKTYGKHAVMLGNVIMSCSVMTWDPGIVLAVQRYAVSNSPMIGCGISAVIGAVVGINMMINMFCNGMMRMLMRLLGMQMTTDMQFDKSVVVSGDKIRESMYELGTRMNAMIKMLECMWMQLIVSRDCICDNSVTDMVLNLSDMETDGQELQMREMRLTRDSNEMTQVKQDRRMTIETLKSWEQEVSARMVQVFAAGVCWSMAQILPCACYSAKIGMTSGAGGDGVTR
jgi:hypothetical protein